MSIRLTRTTRRFFSFDDTVARIMKRALETAPGNGHHHIGVLTYETMATHYSAVERDCSR